MDQRNDITNELQGLNDMIRYLRQNTDAVWDYINHHIGEVIAIMMKIVQWGQEMVEAGEAFPIDTVLQQVQNLNEAYTAKDEVLLADTLEYEIRNTIYVYMENQS